MQTIFVSVDPGRDTLKRMKSYVELFDPTFIGATGPFGRLDVLTRQLGVLHFRAEPDLEYGRTIRLRATMSSRRPE